MRRGGGKAKRGEGEEREGSGTRSHLGPGSPGGAKRACFFLLRMHRLDYFSDDDVVEAAGAEAGGAEALAIVPAAGAEAGVEAAPVAPAAVVPAAPAAPDGVRKRRWVQADCGRGRHGSRAEQKLVCARMREGPVFVAVGNS